MATKKEVAKSEETAVQLWEEEAAAGTGFEDTSSEDYAIPFVNLLQKGSPQVDEDNGAYVEGAKAGMFYNAATGELGEEYEFIPCHYHRAMVEWHDREEGGGFIAQHPVGYEANFEKDDRGRWVTGPGTHLVDTRYFFGLGRMAGSDADFSPAVLSFSSTQTKKARNWMTQMQNLKGQGQNGPFTMPMFSHLYRLSAVGESKDDYTWKGYKVTLVGLIEDQNLARQAKEARELFMAAATNVKPPASEAAGDDEVPF